MEAFVGSVSFTTGKSTFAGQKVAAGPSAFTASPVRRSSVIAMATGLDKSKIPLNLFRPNAPYTAKVISNEKIVGDDAPGDTRHLVFNHDGNVPYLEGQSIGVMAPGTDAKGKPNKVRLYSIASTAKGDLGDSKHVSLCVKRLIYTNDEGKEIKGVCSNHLCDLKPGDDVKISGPVGTAMLMPQDPDATIIMLGTGTGIAPFRAFIWRAFMENNPDYKFTGQMWLFLGVPTTPALLYQDDLNDIMKKYPDNFRVDYCISREQTDSEGNKMYIQTRMKEYAETLYKMFKEPHTYVYMCGLKGMEPGIDELMSELFAKDGMDWVPYRRQMKKDGRWEVETY